MQDKVLGFQEDFFTQNQQDISNQRAHCLSVEVVLFSSVLETGACIFIFIHLNLPVSWPEMLEVFEKINYLEVKII